jgi:hypothetical protein
MAQSGQRKCLCCGHFFKPDHRNGQRQRYCSSAQCQRASKAASQAAWLAQPQNKDYFAGPVHVARVQAWRAAHPGYSRGKPRTGPALQDSLISQADDSIDKCVIRTAPAGARETVALQDIFNAPSPLLAGLIAHLFEVTLQEDIAATTRHLVQLGQDVINRSGCHEERQAGAAARAAAPGARAVQLG